MTEPRLRHPQGRDWPADGDSLRRAVLHRLDLVDQVAGAGDPTTLLPMARTELHRLADGWRLLLGSHRADEDGRCSACRRRWRARRWPCPVWRSAHQQLIGEGLPHRERAHPLRIPFRLAR